MGSVSQQQTNSSQRHPEFCVFLSSWCLCGGPSVTFKTPWPKHHEPTTQNICELQQGSRPEKFPNNLHKGQRSFKNLRIKFAWSELNEANRKSLMGFS